MKKNIMLALLLSASSLCAAEPSGDDLSDDGKNRAPNHANPWIFPEGFFAGDEFGGAPVKRVEEKDLSADHQALLHELFGEEKEGGNYYRPDAIRAIHRSKFTNEHADALKKLLNLQGNEAWDKIDLINKLSQSERVYSPDDLEKISILFDGLENNEKLNIAGLISKSNQSIDGFSKFYAMLRGLEQDKEGNDDSWITKSLLEGFSQSERVYSPGDLELLPQLLNELSFYDKLDVMHAINRSNLSIAEFLKIHIMLYGAQSDMYDAKQIFGSKLTFSHFQEAADILNALKENERMILKNRGQVLDQVLDDEWLAQRMANPIESWIIKNFIDSIERSQLSPDQLKAFKSLYFIPNMNINILDQIFSGIGELASSANQQHQNLVAQILAPSEWSEKRKQLPLDFDSDFYIATVMKNLFGDIDDEDKRSKSVIEYIKATIDGLGLSWASFLDGNNGSLEDLFFSEYSVRHYIEYSQAQGLPYKPDEQNHNDENYEDDDYSYGSDYYSYGSDYYSEYEEDDNPRYRSVNDYNKVYIEKILLPAIQKISSHEAYLSYEAFVANEGTGYKPGMDINQYWKTVWAGQGVDLEKEYKLPDHLMTKEIYDREYVETVLLPAIRKISSHEAYLSYEAFVANEGTGYKPGMDINQYWKTVWAGQGVDLEKEYKLPDHLK